MTPIFLAVAALLVVLFVCFRQQQRKLAGFKDRFPPISDEEFVQRCGPGTNPEIALKVRRIVSDALGVEYDRIYPSSRFVEDLGID